VEWRHIDLRKVTWWHDCLVAQWGDIAERWIYGIMTLWPSVILA
jgi:hypothetical protein